jgi:ribosome-associated protein
MKTPALTKLAVAALEDLKGQDIQVMDVKALTPMTDVMIICSGTSTRHVKALAQNVMDEAREKNHRPLGVEGLDQGEWALVDLNGVLVHVMQAQTRAFYQLEKLWAVTPPPVEESSAVAKPKPKSKAAAKTGASKAKAAPKAKAATKPRAASKAKAPARSKAAPARGTAARKTPAARSRPTRSRD